ISALIRGSSGSSSIKCQMLSFNISPCIQTMVFDLFAACTHAALFSSIKQAYKRSVESLSVSQLSNRALQLVFCSMLCLRLMPVVQAHTPSQLLSHIDTDTRQLVHVRTSYIP